MPAQRTKIVVFGGSGFVGREICRIARSMGHHVVSISPSGRPDVGERWVEGIEWVAGNVFSADEWRDELEGAEAVIVSMGSFDETTRRGDEDGDTDWERAADVVAEQADRADVDALVYISTAGAPPSVDDSYLAGRRRAERDLAGRNYKLAVLRPTLIVGSDRPESVVRGALVDLIARAPGGGDWAETRRSIRRELVAICALRAALEPDISGVLEIDDIAHLGDAMFIQSSRSGHSGPNEGEHSA